MTKKLAGSDEETQPLTQEKEPSRTSEDESRDSFTSDSTTSLYLEHINANTSKLPAAAIPYTDGPPGSDVPDKHEPFDVEKQKYYGTGESDKKYRRILWIVSIIGLAGWMLALFYFISSGAYKHSSTRPHDPDAQSSRGSGKKVALGQVLSGQWYPRTQSFRWVHEDSGRDGLFVEQGVNGKDYLIVENIRNRDPDAATSNNITLMQYGGFYVGSKWVSATQVWPSRDLKKVLVLSEREKNWRHSFTGLYWIFDVATQTAEPLDLENADARVQLASWSPRSDAIVFTRNNNMFLRKLTGGGGVVQITKDGGKDLFYGIPDWVYEEEVLSGNSATWWSEDGKYIAFFRTDESEVPTFPVQYFLSRPSGMSPPPGLEDYPEVRDIKYPKAGAPNPVVDLQFYDIGKGEVFSLDIENDFTDDDRLVTEVVWAGRTGKAIVKETNRESDILKVVLMDVERRSGRTIREVNVTAIDGGWFEVSKDTTFIPSDPANGRKHDGYIDTVIHGGYDHLAYFSPLDSSEPIMLTSGNWEVVDAPTAIDLKNNLIYFVATKESSIQRHVYQVKLDGTDLKAITDTSREGYYSVSFSSQAGYAILTYNGPNIPWQKVISTPSNNENYQLTIEENGELAKLASQHELPIKIYSTVNIEGHSLNVVELRPAHFDPRKKYPVLFYLYNGPGFQLVDKRFTVDFQSYIASSLEYIVVTLDARGTGYIGRDARVIVRGNLGYYEAHDQIETAKIWAKKSYVDQERIAIWGWSYGGFMTLKTLEQDAGQTFKYGMAVAPVTDWRHYDSVYTERYMHTPQHNPDGYENSTVSNATALQKNVRFLIMHGVSDDNVHFQNSLTLLDELDLAGVENYDVHIFPDSDHSIYFHNAHKIVYDKLNNWLINAFNGEWLKVTDAKPMSQIIGKVRMR